MMWIVDPTHVGKLSGKFGEAFEKNHKNQSADTLKERRNALQEVAYLKGSDLPNHTDCWDKKVNMAALEEIPAECSSNAKSKAHTEEKIVTVPSEIIAANEIRILSKIPKEALSKSKMTESTSNKTKSTLPNVHMKSKNLLTELSNRLKRSPLTGDTSSSLNSRLVVPIDIIQQHRKSLANFLNMSVERIQEANAFEDVKRTARDLVRYSTDVIEKTIVEDLIAHIEEFKDSIPSAMAMTEVARAQVESLRERTKQVDTKLQKMQVLLTSLEAEISRISEEEKQVEAEILRLMLRKMELYSLKDSVALDLEKASEETSKDLEEWEKLDMDSKQVDHTCLEAKKKLADANTFFKLTKEKLTL